ncbi:MAG: hypothetical protein AAFV95_27450 [Bacteroidota bacterium]
MQTHLGSHLEQIKSSTKTLALPLLAHIKGGENPSDPFIIEDMNDF